MIIAVPLRLHLMKRNGGMELRVESGVHNLVRLGDGGGGFSEITQNNESQHLVRVYQCDCFCIVAIARTK